MDGVTHLDRAEYSRKWYEKNVDRLKALSKIRYQKNSALRKEQAAARYAATKELRKQQTAEWRKNNPEKVRKYLTDWKTANVERLRELRRIRHHKNKEKRNAESNEYRKNNPEKIKAMKAAYRKNNPDKSNEYCSKRRAAHNNATPKWANNFFIKEAYHLATLRTKMFGFSWHVDHKVPLQSKLVCGLHVENNLAVIPGIVNIRKHNSYWPDMP